MKKQPGFQVKPRRRLKSSPPPAEETDLSEIDDEIDLVGRRVLPSIQAETKGPGDDSLTRRSAFERVTDHSLHVVHDPEQIRLA